MRFVLLSDYTHNNRDTPFFQGRDGVKETTIKWGANGEDLNKTKPQRNKTKWMGAGGGGGAGKKEGKARQEQECWPLHSEPAGKGCRFRLATTDPCLGSFSSFCWILPAYLCWSCSTHKESTRIGRKLRSVRECQCSVREQTKQTHDEHVSRTFYRNQMGLPM